MEKDEENNISSNHSESEEEDVELDSDEEVRNLLIEIGICVFDSCLIF